MNYLLGLALIVIGGLILELSHVRASYERMFKLLITDRDEARAEVQTLREALFPQLAKLAKGEPKRAQAAATPPGHSSQPPAFSSRIPWRQQFRQLVRNHNTLQRGRDGLAAAISKAQETSNVS